MRRHTDDSRPSTRARIELGFERWASFVIRRRWWVTLITLAISGFFMSWLPRLTLDNSIESFLRPDDPAVLLYNSFKDRFARDDLIIVGIAPERVFDVAFFEKLRAFQQDLENEAPYIDEVTSLLNARETRAEGDTLIVGELVENFPKTQLEVDGIAERALANPLYRNALISADGSLTVVAIKPLTYSTLGVGEALGGFDDADETEAEFLTAAENDELVTSLRELVARHDTPDFSLHLIGALILTDTINRKMMSDIALFMSLGTLAIFGLLFLLFRRIGGVLLPLAVCQLSLMTTLGIMVMLEIPGSAAVQMLPLFLLTVGICDSVHILTIVYQELAKGRSREDSITTALGHSGLAVVMTSITTAAGLLSFATSGLAVVAHLGVIAPIGIMLALVYTLALLPAVLAIFPLKAPHRERTGTETSLVTRTLTEIGSFAARHPWQMVAAATLFVLLSVAGIPRVRFSHNGLEWFPPTEPLAVGYQVIDRALEGSITLEILIDTGREDGLHDPNTLLRIERAMRHAEAIDTAKLAVGKATSIVDVIHETHQALNGALREYRRIPKERELVAQELLLFENGGSEDLEELVDSQFRTGRLSLSVPWVNALHYVELMDLLERDFREILGPEIDFEMTGLMGLLSRTFSEMIFSMLRSYAFALLVITPLMMLLLGSLRMGLISMIPNLIPVVFTMGLMGWLDVPLDVSSIMIGAIVIGLAVDDTIHFMHKFERYYSESGDAPTAVRATLITTGTALLVTTLVLSTGFFIFGQAYMQNMARFGLLAGCATIVAFLADVLIGPALMVLVARWRSGAEA